MKDFIVITASDWSEITKENILDADDAEKEELLEMLRIYAADAESAKTMGLHIHENRLWTGGFIGAKSFELHNSKDVILYISPRFCVDPYKMLDCVMNDEEYDRYIYDTKEKPLFEIFDREPMIPSSDSDMGGQLLLAVSYIKSCEAVCKKALKSQMTFFAENLHGKIKGKILFSKHIKHNVSVGREDRVFCRYQTFSMDTQENRILKSALIKAVKLLNDSNVDTRRKLPGIRKTIRYCMKTLENVKTVNLSSSQFVNIKVNGMYSYYQRPMRLAKLINAKGFLSASYDKDHSYKILPYAINMEALFEFYVRTRMRAQNVFPEDYKTSHRYLKNVSYSEDKKHHLSDTFIPDIVIYDRPDDYDGERKCLGVYDVKYKDHQRPDRNDSLQIMAYALMFDTDKCGFIMPLPKNVPAHAQQVHGQAAEPCKFIKSVEGKVATKRDIDLTFYEYLLWT